MLHGAFEQLDDDDELDGARGAHEPQPGVLEHGLVGLREGHFKDDARERFEARGRVEELERGVGLLDEAARERDARVAVDAEVAGLVPR